MRTPGELEALLAIANERIKQLEQRLLLSSEAEKGEMHTHEELLDFGRYVAFLGERTWNRSIGRRESDTMDKEARQKMVIGLYDSFKKQTDIPSPPTAQEKKGVNAFRCKCGFETNNTTEWCIHADSCERPPAPAAPDKGEEKPEDCIVGVNSYAPNGIVDDPFQPNATTESDARAFIFNERMAGRLRGYDKIPYELRTEIYRVIEKYKNLKPTPSVEKSEGEEAWETFVDASYFGKFAVRLKGDKDFNSQRLFHVDSFVEAETLCSVLNEYSSLLHSSGDRGRKEQKPLTHPEDHARNRPPRSGK